VQALLLPLADEWYALELAAVREVVPAPAITHLPGAPAGVLGVFNLRGEVVPVLDTAALLGIGRLSHVTHVAVVETEAGLGGLAADGPARAGALGEPAGPADLPGALGRYAADGRLATLLDVDDVLSPQRIGLPE
jgi:hypothetical protein